MITMPSNTTTGTSVPKPSKGQPDKYISAIAEHFEKYLTLALDSKKSNAPLPNDSFAQDVENLREKQSLGKLNKDTIAKHFNDLATQLKNGQVPYNELQSLADELSKNDDGSIVLYVSSKLYQKFADIISARTTDPTRNNNTFKQMKLNRLLNQAGNIFGDRAIGDIMDKINEMNEDGVDKKIEYVTGEIESANKNIKLIGQAAWNEIQQIEKADERQKKLKQRNKEAKEATQLLGPSQWVKIKSMEELSERDNAPKNALDGAKPLVEQWDESGPIASTEPENHTPETTNTAKNPSAASETKKSDKEPTTDKTLPINDKKPSLPNSQNTSPTPAKPATTEEKKPNEQNRGSDKKETPKPTEDELITNINDFFSTFNNILENRNLRNKPEEAKKKLKETTLYTYLKSDFLINQAGDILTSLQEATKLLGSNENKSMQLTRCTTSIEIFGWNIIPNLSEFGYEDKLTTAVNAGIDQLKATVYALCKKKPPSEPNTALNDSDNPKSNQPTPTPPLKSSVNHTSKKPDAKPKAETKKVTEIPKKQPQKAEDNQATTKPDLEEWEITVNDFFDAFDKILNGEKSSPHRLDQKLQNAGLSDSNCIYTNLHCIYTNPQDTPSATRRLYFALERLFLGLFSAESAASCGLEVLITLRKQCADNFADFCSLINELLAQLYPNHTDKLTPLVKTRLATSKNIIEKRIGKLEKITPANENTETDTQPTKDEIEKNIREFFNTFNEILNDEKLRNKPKNAIEKLKATKIYKAFTFTPLLDNFTKNALENLEKATSRLRFKSTKIAAKNNCIESLTKIKTILKSYPPAFPDDYDSIVNKEVEKLIGTVNNICKNLKTDEAKTSGTSKNAAANMSMPVNDVISHIESFFGIINDVVLGKKSPTDGLTGLQLSPLCDYLSYLTNKDTAVQLINFCKDLFTELGKQEYTSARIASLLEDIKGAILLPLCNNCENNNDTGKICEALTSQINSLKEHINSIGTITQPSATPTAEQSISSEGPQVERMTSNNPQASPTAPTLTPKKPSSDHSTNVKKSVEENAIRQFFETWREVIEENKFENKPTSENSVIKLMHKKGLDEKNNLIYKMLTPTDRVTNQELYTYHMAKKRYQNYSLPDLLNLIPCIARECGEKNYIRDCYDQGHRHLLPSELCENGMEEFESRIKKLVNYEWPNKGLSNIIANEIKQSNKSLDTLHIARFNEFPFYDNAPKPAKIKELRKTNIKQGINNYNDVLREKTREIVEPKPTELMNGKNTNDTKTISLLDTFCNSLKDARVSIEGITPKKCEALKNPSTTTLSNLIDVDKATKKAPPEISLSKTSRFIYYFARILFYSDHNMTTESNVNTICSILDKYDKQISKLKPSFFNNATISDSGVKAAIREAVSVTKIFLRIYIATLTPKNKRDGKA